MIAEGALVNPDVKAIFGLHVEPSLDTGQLSCNRGVAWASVDNFAITFQGKQGHAARPRECRDALLAAASFLVEAQSIVPKRVDPLQPAVLHVGALEVLEPRAPGRRNVVAGLVRMEGTLRTHHGKTRAIVERALRQLASATVEAHDLRGVTVHWTQGSPPGYLHPPLGTWGETVLAEFIGKKRIHHLLPGFAGEDFARYLVRVPGMFFLLGVHPPGEAPLSGLHNSAFAPDENALLVGIRSAVALLLSYGETAPKLGAYRPKEILDGSREGLRR